MDTTTQKAPAQTAPGIARISGRLEATRTIDSRDGKRRLSLVRLPAPDEFTSPATVEVTSRQPIGVKGDQVQVNVRIAGYSRSFPMTDKETGEKFIVSTATNTLEVVEG